MPGLGAITLQEGEDLFIRISLFLLREELVWSQKDQSQGGVVRNIAVRSKYVYAIDGAYPARDSLESICDFPPDIALFIESRFPIFHLSTKICSSIKPKPRRI